MKYLIATFLGTLFTVLLVIGCTSKPTSPTAPSMDTFVYTTMVDGVLETYITTIHNDTNKSVKYFLQDASPTRIQLMIQKSRLGIDADSLGVK